MSNVAQLTDRLPSKETAKRDAIAALVDGVLGALAEQTAVARRQLEEFDKSAMQHAARVKIELESFVAHIEELTDHAASTASMIETMRKTHARLVNQRVAE